MTKIKPTFPLNFSNYVGDLPIKNGSITQPQICRNWKAMNFTKKSYDIPDINILVKLWN